MKQESLYEMAAKLEAQEAIRLIRNAADEEERRFYTYIVNMNLQRRQKETLERNLF